MKKKLIAAGLLGAMFLTGCVKNTEPKNVKATTNIDYSKVDTEKYDEKKLQEEYIKFAFNVYNKCAENSDNSMMISPASVMFALDMCAAGANDETLTQIMALYSGESSVESQFAFTSDWINSINNEEGVTLTTANSFWMNSSVLGDYINHDYVNFIDNKFKAEAKALEFNKDAEDKMNSWIDKNTNGMIKKVVSDLDKKQAAVLINTIAFEGSWETPYEEYQIEKDTFKGSNGNTEVNMLSDNVHYYYESDNMTGFIRYYEGNKYAFLVMLPKDEQADANKFASTLTSDEYLKFWNSRSTDYTVRTKLPEFKSEYETEMNDILKSLGMQDAFDEYNANFKGMADLGDDGNIYVSKVIHKSYIELDRNGTKAAAATVVYMANATAIGEEPKYKEVYCDRPFAYAIVDTTTGMPLFIGTVNNVEEG